MAKRFLLCAMIAFMSLPLWACGENKTAQHKLAIYTAQADAALVGLTDAVFLLEEGRRIQADTARNIYVINLRVAMSIDVLRDRAKNKFDKQDTLAKIDAILEDIRQAEALGVVSLDETSQKRFREITFFAQFTLRSIRAVIDATKEPAVPQEKIAGLRSRAARADNTIWTELVLILQQAVLKGVEQSRMTADEAFADGAALSAQVKAKLTEKLGSGD